jgi:pimeloyl-ACP methyl ester carboxylesterase
MAYINSGGVRIHYQVHGSGPAILLSHGFGATSAMWAGQCDALADYQVIVWDMRGHGRSDSPSDPGLYSAEHTVADMLAILDECRIDQAVIGGLSLGGYMSLAFHLAHPDRVTALMLFDTGPGFKQPQARQGWNDFAIQRAGKFEREGLAALGSGQEVMLSEHRSAEGLAHAARGMLTQSDGRVIESLAGITKPALVLVGAQDKAFLAATDYMANKIPGAVKVVLDDAGHAANIDQPLAFNRSVNAFLAGLN